ncbi:Sec7 domain [Fragilaria crotonensis]|nr:Sec7 domain [Fragilaria crotonensis]
MSPFVNFVLSPASEALAEVLLCEIAIKTRIALEHFGQAPLEIEELDLHISEGVWRICSSVDGLLVLDVNVWQRLLALIQWCAARAGKRTSSSGLSDDDPGLQAYRSLHLILNVPELRDRLPPSLADAISSLVARTSFVGCTKLSLASLDLLHIYQSRLEHIICESAKLSDIFNEELVGKWTHALDAVAEAAWGSRDSIVRSHAMSIITDAFLDKQGSALLREFFVLHCLESAFNLRATHCIHSGDAQDLNTVWSALLRAMESLLQLGEDERSPSHGDAMSPGMLRWTLKELACEHLRNVIMILHAHGVLKGNPSSSDGFSLATWESIDRMTFCTNFAAEWKQFTSAAE